MVCLVSLCHQAHGTELLHAGLFSVAQVAEFKVRREVRAVSHIHCSDVSALVYVMWWFMQGLDVRYETVMRVLMERQPLSHSGSGCSFLGDCLINNSSYSL